ncbi:MAG: ATP-binding protein [Verrucomicrobiota bacterium]
MIVVEGREGRGKTEAARAWCNCHLGVARFVNLIGTNTKTSHFTEFAKALGVGHGNSHKVSQMQAGVQDVLRTSQLMPMIDEAHFFFNQAPRMKTRPEMLDWIDTALCNPPMPVALITTPQFLICMERAAGQVGWNYRQFRRRCKRYARLPLKNTPADIEAVARHLLPDADKATIKQIVAYEALSKRDLSAVGDVVQEAKLVAEKEGASSVAFEHVKRAIYEELIPSDVPFAEMEKRLQQRKLKHKVARDAPSIVPAAAPEAAETQEREIFPRLLPDAGPRRLVRSSSPVEALAGD